MWPGDYTVAKGEPDSWRQALELMAASMITEDRSPHEICVEQSKFLADLRADRHATERAALPPADVATSTRRLQFDTWATFRDSTPEHVEWLVDGMLARGATGFLAAPPKHGKTWVALLLAICVATGRPFLERFVVPDARPVLYIALEGSQAALRARIGSVARGIGIDPDRAALANLHIRYRARGIDLADPAWAQELIDEATRLGAGLVIVDVLRKAAPRLRESGEGATDFAQLIAGLEQLREMDCATVFLHHFAKGNDTTKGRSIGDKMSGSGALFSHADQVVGITERTMDSDGLLEQLTVVMEARDGATTEPFSIRFECEGGGAQGGWTYRDELRMYASDDEPEDARKVKPPEIVAWIIEQGGRVPPAEIRKHFDVSKTTLGRYLKDDLAGLGISVEGHGSSTRWAYRSTVPSGGGSVARDTYRSTAPPPIEGGAVGGVALETVRSSSDDLLTGMVEQLDATEEPTS